MCDIFTTKDLQKLLFKKNVLLIGSSNMRAVYKDLIWLWNKNTLVSAEALRKKLEPSFMGDRLLKGERLVRGRDYEEVREFKNDSVHIAFHFITKCYTDAVERLMTDIKKRRKDAPDVLIYNSCLWDLTRWGPNGVQVYKDNLVRLMKLLKKCLPAKTIVIWLTTAAVSQDSRGGLFVKQVEFMKHYLRFEVMEANLLARQIVVSHGFDFLDTHYYLRMQLHRRAPDGVHWLPVPMRHITNLILTHVALSWECKLPGNFDGLMLEKVKSLSINDDTVNVKLPKLPTGMKIKEKNEKRKSLLRSPVCGSPFRVFMKNKLQKISNPSEPDKENIPVSANKPISWETPKRNMESKSQKLSNDVVRRAVAVQPARPVLASVQNQQKLQSQYQVAHRWKEPDFSNSPLRDRNYPLNAQTCNFVYKQVPLQGKFLHPRFIPQNLAHGPVRQREVSRHTRRHNPYY